jgi:alkylation response protein AidB-like acyl-CoA dehydrogenase
MPTRARTRATAAWAVRRAVVVVETAYRSGGGTAIYRTCPLERRLRDVHALQQHFIVRSNTMTTAGAVLLGRDVDVPLF